MSRKKTNLEKVAEELTDAALRHLKTFSEEEQERRISAAERRLCLMQDTLTNVQKWLK